MAQEVSKYASMCPSNAFVPKEILGRWRAPMALCINVRDLMYLQQSQNLESHFTVINTL